ncbi:hypothetical protein MTo_04437 [Microcystis aeruginosa NIES-1211]|uniref:type II toxin-antitoxin system VapC family toxin n=1 Tax=Microcystis TaxID=1125 RepID=UPI000D837448|nr:hypothetical protein [Microcystis aeruginosa]GBL17107.1 hypothetical protein MTo_04437 [Microcystis aeruginosa NIES-1211]
MSEVIVLDTHIWLWLINGNFDRFPEHWLEKFELAESLGVSPISCYEIALANQRGRLELSYPLQEWIQQALTVAKIAEVLNVEKSGTKFDIIDKKTK